MCMTVSGARSVRKKYNYDGGKIIHKCIVPSSRLVVNSDKDYAIDVREFLVTERNEVVKQVIHREIKEFIQTNYNDPLFNSLAARHGCTSVWDYFTSREKGAFDFRTFVICSFLKTKIKYKGYPTDKEGFRKKRKGTIADRDPWLFPDEMLSVCEGDCEDIALLIASLFIGSGISSYNVRVSLGKVESGGTVPYDHMWVMYKNERGKWRIIEPMSWVKNTVPYKGKKSANIRPEYRPVFIFNDDHLWQVDENEKDLDGHLAERWKSMDPGFVGKVHQTLLHGALAGAGGYPYLAR